MIEGGIVSTGTLQLPRAWLRAFAEWWIAGLRETIPVDWLHWAAPTVTPSLTLWHDHHDVISRLVVGGRTVEHRVARQGFGASALARMLARSGHDRAEVNVGLAIPREQFFVRELTMPKAARDALPRVLEQEVLRRTPFELSDIWHGTTERANAASGLLILSHWIIRRDHAQHALAELGLEASDVDFLAASHSEFEAEPAITLRAITDEDPPWVVRLVRALGIAAFAAIVVALVGFEWFQASVASSLETSLEEVRHGTRFGEGVNPAARLLAMKSEIGFLEVWDELSRILPDDTYLTELRVSDGKVTLSGRSADAARLVRTIDRSALFSEAFLDGAITHDTNERKDHFTIGCKVRGLRPARAAIREPAS